MGKTLKSTVNEILESDEGIVVMNAANKGRSTELPERRPSPEGKLGDSNTPYTQSWKYLILGAPGRGRVCHEVHGGESMT